MKKLGKLNLKKEKMLSHEELVSFRGGSGGTSSLDYCKQSYMIRSCNELTGGTLASWSAAWGSNGCSQYSGALLWDPIMASSQCDTSWYSY